MMTKSELKAYGGSGDQMARRYKFYRCRFWYYGIIVTQVEFGTLRELYTFCDKWNFGQAPGNTYGILPDGTARCLQVIQGKHRWLIER